MYIYSTYIPSSRLALLLCSLPGNEVRQLLKKKIQKTIKIKKDKFVLHECSVCSALSLATRCGSWVVQRVSAKVTHK